MNHPSEILESTPYTLWTSEYTILFKCRFIKEQEIMNPIQFSCYIDFFWVVVINFIHWCIL